MKRRLSVPAEFGALPFSPALMLAEPNHDSARAKAGLRCSHDGEARQASMNVAAGEPCLEHCPHCPDQGWYPRYNYYTGDPEQVQCEWCYTNPKSVFNNTKP